VESQHRALKSLLGESSRSGFRFEPSVSKVERLGWFVVGISWHSVTRLGEFFAYWVIVFWAVFSENFRRSTHFIATFSHGKKLCINLEKKIWLRFGRFFHKLIWSLWLALTFKLSIRHPIQLQLFIFLK
jgi:hypothetical protein